MDNSLKRYESIQKKYKIIVIVCVVLSILAFDITLLLAVKFQDSENLTVYDTLFMLFMFLTPLLFALLFGLKEIEVKRWKENELDKLGFVKIGLNSASYRKVTLFFIDFKNNKTFKTFLNPLNNTEYNYYFLFLSFEEKKDINGNINIPDIVDVKLLGVSQRYQEGYSFTVYSFRIKYCDGSIKAITVPEGSKLCISLLAMQEILQQQRNISKAVNF